MINYYLLGAWGPMFLATAVLLALLAAVAIMTKVVLSRLLTIHAQAVTAPPTLKRARRNKTTGRKAGQDLVDIADDLNKEREGRIVVYSRALRLLIVAAAGLVLLDLTIMVLLLLPPWVGGTAMLISGLLLLGLNALLVRRGRRRLHRLTVPVQQVASA